PRPFTRTRPAVMSPSAARRKATPARARIFWSRSLAIWSPAEKRGFGVSRTKAAYNPMTMRRVDKPWGHELIWAETARYVGKVLHIRAGQRLSRQYHRVKEETLMVQSGEMDLEIGAAGAVETRRMKAGD